MSRVQARRFWLRTAFFALFVLAPPLDIFRLDLKLGTLIIFGRQWTLGRDALLNGQVDVGQAVLTLILHGFLPLALLIGLGVWVAWRYGRLYCGWLCPHFSVVELVNGAMMRAWGRPTLWERRALPARRPDGRVVAPRPLYWLAVALIVLFFALLWAVSLLTYLWPPFEVYANLLHGTPSRFQAIFMVAATLAFVIEFLAARHLFCRYGCAIGLFQSLVWMANKRAMVVRFERAGVNDCIDCNSACDNACPMRLPPRATKRHMFTCTQCARCIEACSNVHDGVAAASLLQWVDRGQALDVSDRDFGRGPGEPERPMPGPSRRLPHS